MCSTHERQIRKGINASGHRYPDFELLVWVKFLQHWIINFFATQPNNLSLDAW